MCNSIFELYFTRLSYLDGECWYWKPGLYWIEVYLVGSAVDEAQGVSRDAVIYNLPCPLSTISALFLPLVAPHFNKNSSSPPPHTNNEMTA